jgi:hypothetical protein
VSQEARQASDEIEVTPEMIEAGALALLHFDPGWNDRETAIRVFRAMKAASTQELTELTAEVRKMVGQVVMLRRQLSARRCRPDHVGAWLDHVVRLASGTRQ